MDRQAASGRLVGHVWHLGSTRGSDEIIVAVDSVERLVKKKYLPKSKRVHLSKKKTNDDSKVSSAKEKV